MKTSKFITPCILTLAAGCDLGDPHNTNITHPTTEICTEETQGGTHADTFNDTGETSDDTGDTFNDTGETSDDTGDTSNDTGDTSNEIPDTTNDGSNPLNPVYPGNPDLPPFKVYDTYDYEVRPHQGEVQLQGQGVRIYEGWVVDNCGYDVVVRGVEQPLGVGIGDDGHDAIIDEIAKMGGNSVRLLVNQSPNSSDGALTLDEMEGAIKTAADHEMLVFVSPGYVSGGQIDDARCKWFADPDVKAILQRYGDHVVIDAYAEPDFDDRDEWVAEAVHGVECVRDAGYTNMLNVLANDHGRDGLSLFERSEEILDQDEMRQIIFGWQAYWGQSRIIEEWWGTNIHDMAADISKFRKDKQINIQMGILHWADPGDPMDYVTAMSDSETLGIGWLWWEFFNPFNAHGQDDVSWDGTIRYNSTTNKPENLRPHGYNVYWEISKKAAPISFRGDTCFS